MAFTPLVNDNPLLMLLFSDLDGGKLTKRKLSVVIRSVSKWKALAELYPTDETIAKIENMENELKRLLGGLGAKVKLEPATAPGNNHLHDFESICR